MDIIKDNLDKPWDWEVYLSINSKKKKSYL